VDTRTQGCRHTTHHQHISSLPLPLSSLLATPPPSTPTATTDSLYMTGLLFCLLLIIFPCLVSAAPPIQFFDMFSDSMCTKAFIAEPSWTSLTSLSWGQVAVLDNTQLDRPASSVKIPCASDPYSPVGSVAALCYDVARPSSNEYRAGLAAVEWLVPGCPDKSSNQSRVVSYAFTNNWNDWVSNETITDVSVVGGGGCYSGNVIIGTTLYPAYARWSCPQPSCQICETRCNAFLECSGCDHDCHCECKKVGLGLYITVPILAVLIGIGLVWWVCSCRKRNTRVVVDNERFFIRLAPSTDISATWV
jgi:hypothetical protein